MPLFHRHQYVEQERYFNMPHVTHVEKMQGASDTMLKIIYGVTVIISRCSCGKLMSTEVLGICQKRGVEK